MLKLEHVTKYYDENKAVDDLSFSVEDGEIFGLLGVNGAGKTTTFRMIMGLLDMTEGEITLDGKKIDYSLSDKIGFLTEERSLLLKLTVEEQAQFYGHLKGMSKEEIEENLDYFLKRFKIEEYKNRKIKEEAFLNKGTPKSNNRRKSCYSVQDAISHNDEVCLSVHQYSSELLCFIR